MHTAANSPNNKVHSFLVIIILHKLKIGCDYCSLDQEKDKISALVLWLLGDFISTYIPFFQQNSNYFLFHK